jgi:DNA-binding IclR family transcriptional regulator
MPRSEERPAPAGKAEAQTSQGAARAARVLRAVAESEWSITALGRQLGVERRTLGRVVSALEGEGFVSRNRAGLLQPGHHYVAAAQSIAKAHGLAAIADEVVADLRSATGSTSLLHVPHGDYLFVEVSHMPPDEFGVVFPTRRSIEMWRGIGRAFLQHSSAAEIRRLSALSPHDNLEDVLERERELGFAVSHGELASNVTAIGAPVLDGESVVGVLTVVGLDPDLPIRYGDVLLDSARRLERLIAARTQDS